MQNAELLQLIFRSGIVIARDRIVMLDVIGQGQTPIYYLILVHLFPVLQ